MEGRKKTAKRMVGQEERFLEAFDTYHEALFRHATLRLSDRERAIDLVHDTYTKVWSYIKDGHTVEQFRPFLYKVLNNLIVDEYRKRREQSLDALLAVEGVDEGAFPDLQESSVESLAATLDGRKAFEALDALPREYKEVIILRFVDGLGPKEISLLLEESENVVSVRLHRALGQLRKHMAAAEEAAEVRRRLHKPKQ